MQDLLFHPATPPPGLRYPEKLLTLYVQRNDEPSVFSQHKFPIRDDLGDTYLRCQSYDRFHTRCKDSPSGQIYTGPQLADTGEGLVSVVLAK